MQGYISEMASRFLDSLYGDIVFDDRISELLNAAVVQRLRHVRLSNIDSVAIPGIADLSRFEHVIGVAHLARNTNFAARRGEGELMALTAAALLHDWAITAFGHLVEEAFNYVGAQFDHEGKLYEIVSAENSSEIGGVDRQIFCGRETGLGKWAQKVAGQNADAFLKEITNCIRGQGKFGHLIAGDIDLDNIDNVFRMAFHMGMAVDREAPVRLASSILDVRTSDGAPVFRKSAVGDIGTWLDVRRRVYERLMLAEPDFSAKLMVIYAAVQAYRHGEIDQFDWNLTDHQFVQKLLQSSAKECKETVDRWLVGDYWNTTPLVWMAGKRPAYSKVFEFSEYLTEQLGRRCFAYSINDKRDRQLEIHFDDERTEIVGQKANQWLLGVGSPLKKAFSASESKSILKFAEDFFGASFKANAKPERIEDGQEPRQPCLL